MTIQEHVPLAPLTTFRIGGPARYFAPAQNIQEVREALSFAKEKELKVFILGGGSNVLVPDAGFDGLVIKIEFKGVEIQKNGDGTLCIAAAGEWWDSVVASAVGSGLWGVENLSGIPGTIGGAVVQNIGAYGAALSEVLAWVEVLDTTDDAVKKLSAEDCMFGYRGSIFKRAEGRYVVLRAALRLSALPRPDISYKDLTQYFKDTTPSGVEIRSAVLAIRRSKFPDLDELGTAGSFFKNPVMPPAQARALEARYPGMPLFSLPESADIKVPLGWFLDWHNGVIDLRAAQVGGARLFEKHFLVIVAKKNSLASDVAKLARDVQHIVKEKIDIDIEPEVKIL